MSQKFLIGIGATKCGSSALTRFLSEHPTISGSLINQPNYFLSDSNTQEVKWKKDFSKLFQEKANATYNFEFSPDYLTDPKSADAIKETFKNQDLKLICILRNPVDRFLSWYAYGKQIGVIDTEETIGEFIKKQKNLDQGIPYNAKITGQYSSYLKTYFTKFKEDQILIIFQEDLKVNPKKTVQKVCIWLGIDEKFYDSYEFFNVNKTIKLSNKGTKLLNYYSTFHKTMVKLVARFPGLSSVFVPIGRKISTTLKSQLEQKENKEDLDKLDSIYQFYKLEKVELEKLINIKTPW